MHVINQTRNTVLISQVRMADTFLLRLRGLLGSQPLNQGEGLILVGEKSIHTFFMGFSIDVVYLNKKYEVILTQEDMVPYRLGPLVFNSAFVLEMPVGTIAQTNTKVGDQLKFES